MSAAREGGSGSTGSERSCLRARVKRLFVAEMMLPERVTVHVSSCSTVFHIFGLMKRDSDDDDNRDDAPTPMAMSS